MADISKVNVNSTDYDLKDQKSRDALVGVVDSGAKNMSQFNSGTAAADNTTIATGVPLVGHAGEVLVISYETALSSGIITIGFKDANGTATGSVEIGNVTKQKIVTIPEGTAKFNVFVSKAGTYTNFMICTKAEWDISQAYAPYGKTNAELTSDASTLFTENTRQETEIGVVANAGAKNLLPMTHAGGSITRYGVTCTWDLNAGTMALNGTHRSGDSAAIFEFYDGSAEATKILPAGSYVLTGCPAGGSTSTYRAVLSQIAGAVDAGNGVNFELSEPHYAAYRILISGNVTFNNMVFKPMIRPAAITDPTFQPYALPNPILTPALIKQVDEGAKNLVNAPSGSNIRFINIPIVLQPGDYYVLFQNVSSTDTDATTCQFGAFAADDSQASNYPQLSRGNYTASMFTVTKQTAYVRIYASNNFASGANDTVTFTGCMICTKAAWDISHTYQPYRPSWQEMYDRVSTLDGITAKIVYTNALLVSTGTSIGSTGLEYTIKGTSTDTYRLTAVGSYNASQPDELRLVNKVTGSLYGIATRSDVGTNASIIVSGCVATGSNITVEVQAKYVSAGDNYIRLIVEKIPMN